MNEEHIVPKQVAIVTDGDLPEVIESMEATEEKVAEMSTEFLVNEETALARIAADNWIDRLQEIADIGKMEQLIHQRASALDNIKRAAIRRTNPEDWVLFKSSDQRISESTCLLAGSGCKSVAEYYGIRTHSKRPTNPQTGFTPQREADEHGYVTLRMWISGESFVNKLTVEDLEVSISSREDFTGRNVNSKTGALAFKGDASLEQDLRAALQTRADSKVIRILTGLTNVPAALLLDAWEDTAKDLERCRKGHGFGSSKGRRSEKVADDGVASGARDLWNDIMRSMSGDDDAARDILQELTRFRPAGKDEDFPGIRDKDRFSSKRFLEMAAEKWKRHPMNSASTTQLSDGETRQPNGVAPEEEGDS